MGKQEKSIFNNKNPKKESNHKELIKLWKDVENLSLATPPTFNEINYMNKDPIVVFASSSLPVVTITAEEYQQTVLKSVVEDPTLPDNKAVYRRLNQERNKPWKLNPSDIADFYLLEGVISSHASNDYQEDSTNMAVLQAKTRVTDIGRRLLVALTHEQLDEYDRFTKLNGSNIPDDLKEKIYAFYKTNHPKTRVNVSSKAGSEKVMNYYLSAFKKTLDKHSARNDVLDVFSDTDTFDTALRLLASQQKGRWKVMSIAMRALLDKSFPLRELIKQSISDDEDGEGLASEIEAVMPSIEKKRETFLIDRLLNYTHNTGTMSARVTNNIPQSISLLLAHGMPNHEKYLHYYSSLGYSMDALGTLVRRSLPQEEDSDIVEDLSEVVKTNKLPREYSYALLLEFDNPQLQQAVKQTTRENLSPTHVYQLLQKVSHHDGHSKGRLQPLDEE